MKKTVLKGLWLLAATVALPSLPSAGAVINPSFETGDFSGWTVTGSGFVVNTGDLEKWAPRI